MQETNALGVRQQIPGSFEPEALARALSQSGHAWCWLDGEAPARGEVSVSYFGVTEQVFECAAGGEREFLERMREAQTAAPTSPGARGARAMGAAIARAHYPAEPHDATPRTGFHAGWVTALSYEFGVALMGLPPAPDDAPPAFALRLDAVLALTGQSLELRADTPQALAEWMSQYGSLLDAARRHAEPHNDPQRDAGHSPVTTVAESAHAAYTAQAAHTAPTAPAWRRSGTEYEAQVAACQRSIAAGDAYVMCLTDTARLEGRFDPISVYARLRHTGSATRGGIICAGGRALISASPERFLGVRGREISTHPIKGTRPRGIDDRSDRALAAELASDPKERAENLMIVDLMRNDLSRVCLAGSVGVSEFLQVEHHPHVHQLVSTVLGKLAPGQCAIDAIAACFPGGSMTGAPKRRVMELLSSLEAAPRALYSGCFGWLDDAGDAELAMTIRGVELRGLTEPSQVALVGAGGGITADSDAAAERAEKDLKAASVLAVLASAP